MVSKIREYVSPEFKDMTSGSLTGVDISRYIRNNWPKFVNNVTGGRVTENSKNHLNTIQVILEPNNASKVISSHVLRGTIKFKVGKDLRKYGNHLFHGTGLNVSGLHGHSGRYTGCIELHIDDWDKLKAEAAIHRLTMA